MFTDSLFAGRRIGETSASNVSKSFFVNHWLELMRNWIIEANQAENLIKQENLSGMKDFLADIGSNRRLAAGMLLAEFKMPWNFLAETNAEGRSPEATSSANLKWWTRPGSNRLPPHCK